MTRRSFFAAGPWALFVFYLAVGLEVIIMITPFAAYFYSVYAPVLDFLSAHPATAWLTAFFLPHISYNRDPLLTVLAYLGPILLGAGLLIFLICAFQVYSAKLLRRGVVSRGLYAKVRHPQYLGLAIAGLGLLLYWPRFIILILYVVMLFAYYLLARHEERRMANRYGASYEAYAESLPMFLPGNLGGRLLARVTRGRPVGRITLASLFVLSLVASLGVAAALRAYSKARLTTVQEGNVVAVSLTGGDEATLRERLGVALADSQVLERLRTHPDSHTLVAYVLPQEYMMQHLIADLGEHESHHEGGDSGSLGVMAAIKHLAQMYVLKPLQQLTSDATSPAQRIIFTETVAPGRRAVSADRVFAADVLRFPLFFSDLEGSRVAMTMDTPPRHSWGTIPVPAF
jgi:protein-S-isoprenylcysteine O-methyltransferase Ste14